MKLTAREANLLYQAASAQPKWGRKLITALAKSVEIEASEYDDALTCLALYHPDLELTRAAGNLIDRFQKAQKAQASARHPG